MMVLFVAAASYIPLSPEWLKEEEILSSRRDAYDSSETHTLSSQYGNTFFRLMRYNNKGKLSFLVIGVLP